MLRVYNALLLPIRAAAGLWYLRHRRTAARGAEARQRLARELPAVAPGGLWIHGSSVGEAQIVASLARAARRRYPALPLALSAFTHTGRTRLLDEPSADATFYLPFDFPGSAGRLIGALRARLLAIVETELWPNLLDEAHAAGLPVCIVNGRLAPERMNRYRRFATLYGPLLRQLSAVGAQSERDASRFAEMGVPSGAIRVTGNIKYDLPPPEVDVAALRRELGLPPDRPVLVAGSTGDGEEQQVLDAVAAVRRQEPGLFVVLAPRHPERCDDVESLLRRRRVRHHRLSSLDGPLPGGSDLLLVDTLGQLGRLYALATVAFVGGSLVPVGGHNLLEPAALGVPVLFGPHTQHFAEPARALLEGGGGRRVADAATLADAILRLLADPASRAAAGREAERVVTVNRGALNRSLEMILPWLDGRPPRGDGEAP